MDFVTIFAVALGLSFDTFAVSLSYGVVRSSIVFRQATGLAVVFAFFQAGLLVAGYFLGSLISDAVQSADHWIALILLSFLGIRMIAEGLGRKEDDSPRDYSKPIELVTAAVGTSIDAFAVGISFAFLQMNIWLSGIMTGAVTFVASMTAIRIGKSAGSRMGKCAEVIGGLILVAIGIKIFIEHVFSGG